MAKKKNTKHRNEQRGETPPTPEQAPPAKEPKLTPEQEAKISDLQARQESIVTALRTALEVGNTEILQEANGIRDAVREQMKKLGVDLESPEMKQHHEFARKARSIRDNVVQDVELYLDIITPGKTIEDRYKEYRQEQRAAVALADELLYKNGKFNLFLTSMLRLCAEETTADQEQKKTFETIKKMYDQTSETGINPIEMLEPDALYAARDMLEKAKSLYEHYQQTPALRYSDIQKKIPALQAEFTELERQMAARPDIAADAIDPDATVRQQRFAAQQADLTNLTHKLTKASPANDLKLATSRLADAERVARTMRDRLGRATPEAPTETAPNTPVTEEINREDPYVQHVLDAEKRARDQRIKDAVPKPGMLNRILLPIENVLSLDGKIKWYSLNEVFGEFTKFFKGIEAEFKEASEAKTGGPGREMLGWVDPAYAKKSWAGTLSWFRKTAKEKEELMKDYTREKFIGMLSAKPKPEVVYLRAILSILAGRGLLRMSDKELVNIIIAQYGKPNDEIPDNIWEDFAKTGNDTIIKNVFMRVVDDGAAEVGIGQSLFAAQSKGYASSVGLGEGSGKSDVIQDVTAEVQGLEMGIDTAPLDGDGNVIGRLKTMVARGNIVPGNGAEILVTIKSTNNMRERRKKRPADLGTVLLKTVDAYLQGDIHNESLLQLSISSQEGFKVFHCLGEMLLKKTVPTEPGKPNISRFEEWGWISESGGKRYITDEGLSEIPKFFNTRNARAKTTKNGETTTKIVHIAVDSTNFASASRIESSFNSKESIAQAMSGLNLKSNERVFENLFRVELATQRSKVKNDEAVAIIRAIVENIQDAAEMAQENIQRFYVRDSNPLKELSEEEAAAMRATAPEKVGEIAKDRIVTYSKILEKAFVDLYESSADRTLLRSHPLFGKQTLSDYIHDKIPANLRSAYPEVQRAMEQIELYADRSKAKTVNELRAEKNTKGNQKEEDPEEVLARLAA